MVTLGLIEQEGDRYRNNAAAAAFLAGKPGHDLRPMLRYFNGLSYPQWQTLGARLLLVDFWPDPAHSEAAALMSGEFLLISGEGQTYSEQEADEWLKLTKWRKLEHKPLSRAD